MSDAVALLMPPFLVALAIYLVVIGGFAAAVGPSLGSYIVQTIGWPWAFFINLPIGAVSLWWGASLLRERANCAGCNATPLRRAVSVGSFAPNDFGLYDMAGNIAEWVKDCWTDNYKGAPADGSARAVPTCRERVLRGGSFVNDPRYLRSAARFKYDAEVRYYANGFRVAREP